MKRAIGLSILITMTTFVLLAGMALAQRAEPMWEKVPGDLEGPDYLQPPQHYRTLEMMLAEAGIGPAPLGPPPVPVTGTRELLVILVELSDRTPDAAHDVAYFTDRFFDTSPPSVRDFYDEVSYGNFTFVPGAVLGWYESSYSTWHWDNDTVPDSADCRDVVYEAIQMADADIDYSTYDTNGNGTVSNDELTIFIIVSGDVGGAFHYFTNCNHPTLGAGPGSPTCDGKTIEGEFSTTHEDRHIGSYCHELGHDLGLPDLYDTDGGSAGIGQYGLMGGGSWTFSPPTAWCKIQLGWITPTIVTTNGFYDIRDSETHADAFILVDPTHSTTEYFLVENRRPANSYYETIGAPIAPDGTYPDSGLVIYHVDDTQAVDWITSGVNNVNTDEAHKCVDVETAEHPTSHVANADDLDDGTNRGDGDDLWDCNEYDFHDSSNPCEAVWYDGGDSEMSVRVLPCVGSTMRTYLAFGNEPPIANCRIYEADADENCEITVTVANINDGSYDPDGTDDIADLCITHVDGSPVGCQQSAQVAGAGPHMLRLTITDNAGLSDFCDADVTVINTAPTAVCQAFSADADENCCIMVGVADIDGGSTDPEDNLADLLITALDGSPVGPAAQIEVCGQGLHTVTLTATDACGLTHSCDAAVTVLNQPPVAVCMDHTGFADENCCITVGVDSIDGGSYDPDGPGDIVELCITEIDGSPVGCVDEVEICGVDTYTVTLRAKDKCGATSSCDASVTLLDITPPEIAVTLNRYVLWPVNHKMVNIVATIEVEDNCDPDPAVVLTSIISDESPDSLGDGSTDPDIDAAIGTDDRDFKLRSERAGGEDGRTYTITYTATDFSGNSASATVEVEVPHDQSGAALASTAFIADGTGIERSRERFALVIPSRMGVYGVDETGNTVLLGEAFDATRIDISRAYVGNSLGALLPLETLAADIAGDRMDDLVLFYSVEAAEHLVESFRPTARGDLWVAVPMDPLGLHYVSEAGINYLVTDIFQLGEPVALDGGTSSGVDDVSPEGIPEATRLLPVSPNPFSRSTTLRFTLRTDEQVSLSIYDARGALVSTLEDGMLPAGSHQALWNGRDQARRPVAAGIYFVRLQAGAYSATEKMMFLK